MRSLYKKRFFAFIIISLVADTFAGVVVKGFEIFKNFFARVFSPPVFYFVFEKIPYTQSSGYIPGDETSSCIKIYTGSHGIKSESFVTWSQIFRTEGKKIEISCRALSFFFLLTRNSTRTRWRRFFFFFSLFFYWQKFWLRSESYLEIEHVDKFTELEFTGILLKAFKAGQIYFSFSH